MILLKLQLLLLLSGSLGYGGREIVLLVHVPHVHPLVLAVAEAPPDEVLGLDGHGGLGGEVGVGRLQDDVLL